MQRDQLPDGVLRRSFVLSRWKVVYVPTPKAGATSLKWAIAELAGEDLAGFARSTGPEVSRALTIHDRSLWRHTARLDDLDDTTLATIDTSGDWFVFALTRHPVTRLWSAWQSKLLLREPVQAAKFADAPWYPRVPSSVDGVARDFERFVEALDADRTLMDADMHWRPQHIQVCPGRIDYTELGKVEAFTATVAHLETHLRAHGFGGALSIRTENATPLSFDDRFVSVDLARAIADLYRADMDTFGYAALEEIPHHHVDDDPVPELVRLIERSERIGDLADRGGLERARKARRSLTRSWHRRREGARFPGNSPADH